MQAWDFNQPEARAAFRQAAAAEPNASMLHWGLAYALGPGANRRAPAQTSQKVWMAVR